MTSLMQSITYQFLGGGLESSLTISPSIQITRIIRTIANPTAKLNGMTSQITGDLSRSQSKHTSDNIVNNPKNQVA